MKNRNMLILVVFGWLLFFGTTNYAIAKQAIAVDALVGSDDVSGLRLAYRPHYLPVYQFEWLGDAEIYWELSLNIWEYGETNEYDTNLVLAISPVLTKQFAVLANKYPVKWEFGIGISMVNDTRFAGKDIGSHYQFEDRLGLLVDFGEDLSQSLALRYMHYSNGGLNSKNPGMDFLSVAYVYHF